jgi:hypothetical protein
MDLIANIGAWLLTAIMGLVGGILANDACKSADRVCGKIIERAAKRLAPLDQAPKLVEWQADLSERDTTFEKYRHAIGCFLAAGPMRRRAKQIILAMDIGVKGFGTVPLRFDAQKALNWLKLVEKSRPLKLGKTLLFCMILYFTMKFMRAACQTNLAGIKMFAKQPADHKNWRYDVRAEIRGLSFDMTALFNALPKLSTNRAEFDAEYQAFMQNAKSIVEKGSIHQALSHAERKKHCLTEKQCQISKQ